MIAQAVHRYMLKVLAVLWMARKFGECYAVAVTMDSPITLGSLEDHFSSVENENVGLGDCSGHTDL